MKHERNFFQRLCDLLNMRHGKDGLRFELVGSLTAKENSEHDADIKVESVAPFSIKGFDAGLRARKGSGKIIAIDRNCGPAPGRPEGQERLRIQLGNHEADLFFRKGVLID